MIEIIAGMLLTQTLKSAHSRHYGNILAVTSSRSFLFADMQDQSEYSVTLSQDDYSLLRKSEFKSLKSIRNMRKSISFLALEDKPSRLIAYRFAVGNFEANTRAKCLTYIRWTLLNKD